MVLTLAEGRRLSLYWSVFGLALVATGVGEVLFFCCLEASCADIAGSYMEHACAPWTYKNGTSEERGVAKWRVGQDLQLLLQLCFLLLLLECTLTPGTKLVNNYHLKSSFNNLQIQVLP